MLYPVIVNIVNSNKAHEVIVEYSSDIASNGNSKNQELIEEARRYNSNLSSVNIVDAFTNPAEEQSDEYLKILNFNESGMMGYLQIPKIDIKIPIYHGTSNSVLQKGVGHFEGSSFPVGGESTHAVLSAHSGLPSARLFTDLNQLQNGDMFYIYILDQVLAYKVDQVLVVEPSDIDELKLQEGEDYVTLVTCTPYAINTHRLLVRGTRVEYKPEVLESTPVQKKLGNDEIVLYISLFAVLIVLLFVIIFTIKSKKRIKEKMKNKNMVQVPVNNQVSVVPSVPIVNNVVPSAPVVNSTMQSTPTVNNSVVPSTVQSTPIVNNAVVQNNNTNVGLNNFGTSSTDINTNTSYGQNTFNEVKTEDKDLDNVDLI